MSRSRSRTHEPVMTNLVTTVNGVPNAPIPQVAFSRTEEMTDTVTPGWRKMIQQGEVVNNTLGYLSRTRSLSEWTAVWRATQKTAPYTVYTNEATSGNRTLYWLENIYSPLVVNSCPHIDESKYTDIAKQKCLANVDATPYEFFEDLAEVKETIQFLKSPLKSLRDLGRAYKRNKRTAEYIRNPLERAKAIAGVWNTYRFAAAPLYRSIMTAIEAYNDRDVTRPKRRRASGRAQDQLETDPVDKQVGPLGNNSIYHWTEVGARALDVHACIGYEVENPLVDIFFKLGLRLKDVPVVTWEILPLSFMVDRLINIKDFVSGMMNIVDPAVTFVYGNVTTKKLSRYEYSVTSQANPSYTMTITQPDVVIWQDYEQERVTWSPTFSDTFPTFTPENLVKDITSVLDLIAIVISLLPNRS